jgi:terminase large subunit-like protein
MGDAPSAPDAGDDAIRAALDPAFFSKLNFGWEPYPYQREVMDAVLLHARKRIAWVAGRRVGKTETTANIALQLAVRKPGTQVAIFAPSFKQATFLSQRVKFHLAGSKYRANVVVDRIDELRLRFGLDARGKPVDSVILTSSLVGGVRGQGADVLIVDESAFCDGEDYRSKALPFVADRPDAIIIHISTIFSEDDNFSAVLRQFQEDPDGAVFRTPTRLKPGVTAKKLAEYRATMTDTEYQREYECELVPDGGSVFDRRLLTACMRGYDLHDLASLATLEPKRHHTYTLGVDWGKKQDRAVIAVVEQGTQEKANPAKLVFLQVYEADPDNPHHYTRVLDDVLRVARHVNAQRVVADEGEGGHQAEVLRGKLGNRFKPFRFTGKSRNWLVDNARMLLERKVVMLPLEPGEVRKAFAGVQRTDGGYAHLSRQSKDVFDAIGLALLEAAGAASPAERPPMQLLAVQPHAGSRLVGVHTGPMTQLDMLKATLPRECWPLLKNAVWLM